MAKDLPIGHVFEHKGVRLKVVATGEITSCKGCYFDDKNYCGVPYCGALIRKDKRDSIFVETTEPLTE